MNKKLLFLALVFCQINCLDKLEKISPNHYKAELTIEADQKKAVIEKSIKISSADPELEIKNIEIFGNAINAADPALKDLKIFDNNVKVSIELDTQKPIHKAKLHLIYQLAKSKEIVEKFIPITFEKTNFKLIKHQKQIITEKSSRTKNKTEKKFWDYVEKFANWIQKLLKTSGSLWIKLIAVFFLGILMSLTPCIYPMIPITAGILQSLGSKSLTHNFIVSILYALGIATTFAAFGLIAAFTGHLFGGLLTNPIFVIFVVLVMGYMGLSMFGFFEMYIPKFLQGNSEFKSKSIFSAFILGVISGSVTSPCLTPGLAFLLTLVATLGNKFLGFVLLFTAGLGLSLPLLIIGTFSSSLNVLPRAGTWMIEVKKIFGLILFGMCFYFLSKIIPPTYILISMSIFSIIIGIYYFNSINKKKDSNKIRFFKNIMGALFIIMAILIFSKAIQYGYCTVPQEDIFVAWHKDSKSAFKEAELLEKNILVDLGGEFCSICKAIDKKIFADSDVQTALANFVTLKINASEQVEEYNIFKEKFKVIGVPTILLLTSDLKLIRSWGGELYNSTPEKFISELE